MPTDAGPSGRSPEHCEWAPDGGNHSYSYDRSTYMCHYGRCGKTLRMNDKGDWVVVRGSTKKQP